MVEKLRRRMRFCNAAAIIAAVMLMAGIVSGSQNQSGVAALLLMAVMIGTMVIDARLTSRINRLLKEENDRKPIVATTAEVVSRRVRHTYRGGGRGGTVSSKPYWYVTFRTSRNGNVELNVPNDVYLAAKEGTRGELRYRGWEFISFRR